MNSNGIAGPPHQVRDIIHRRPVAGSAGIAIAVPVGVGMLVCDCLEVRQVLPEGAILDGRDQLFWCFPNGRPKVVRRNFAVRRD